jgi:hypothetical protein
MEVKKGTIIVFILFILLLIKYSFKDVIDVFKYFGGKLLPSYPTVGFLIILALIFIIIYYREIKNMLSRINVRR